MRSSFAALLALTTACGAAVSTPTAGLCAQLCPHYLLCSDGPDALYDTSSPILCGGEPQREAACEALCAQSVDALGQSADAFLTCASCVTPLAGDQVCNADQVNDLGVVSCVNSCGTAAANAFDAFRTSFASAMRAADAASCAPGTVEIAASDSRVEHDSGTAQAGGAWSCTSDCRGAPFLDGPDLALAPGDYVIGFRGVAVTSNSLIEAAKIELAAFDGDTLAGQSYLEGDLASGEVSLPLHLISLTVVEPRFFASDATSVQVGSIFVTRQ